MRLLVAGLVLTCGCRQLLGLDDLPADAGRDARDLRDADPSKLALTRVTPSSIREGIGSSSRPAVLVVHGMHIVPGATVEVTAVGGGRAITIDEAQIQVSRDGTMLAFPVSVPPDPGLAAGATLQLDVTVTQDTPAGPLSQTLVQMLQLDGLDELSGGTIALPPGVSVFSQVDATSISAANPAGGPIIIRSMSTVTLDGMISVSANGQSAGAGGGNGGAGGAPVGGMGQPGAGPGAGLPSGGGGTYATKGGGNSPAPVGDPALPTLEAPNRGSGGAGGNSNGTPSAGGAGGGGGGTIEITANGAIVLASIQARGGNGIMAGADDGGGGSGGTILLRSGASVQAASLDVGGGVGMNPGGAGRIRIDAPSVPPTTNPPFYRGPTFALDTPLIVTTAQPAMSASGQPLTTFSYFITNADGDQSRGPFQATFGATGLSTFELEALFEGLNVVCLLVDGGDLARDESRNCIDVAFLF
jgi:hypothetical protein